MKITKFSYFLQNLFTDYWWKNGMAYFVKHPTSDRLVIFIFKNTSETYYPNFLFRPQQTDIKLPNVEILNTQCKSTGYWNTLIFCIFNYKISFLNQVSFIYIKKRFPTMFVCHFYQSLWELNYDYLLIWVEGRLLCEQWWITKYDSVHIKLQ